MRITPIQSTNIYPSSYNQGKTNKTQNTQALQSQYMSQIQNFGYGKDFVNRPNISFKGNEVQKAAKLLLEQVPFEDKLASLFQNLKIGDIIVTGANFNESQKALSKWLNKISFAIKKEIFMQEKSLKNNFAFFKSTLGDIEVLNINDKKMNLITGGKSYKLEAGDSFYIVNNDTLQYGSDTIHLKDKPQHDLWKMRSGFSTVHDFSKEVQDDLAKLNKKTVAKRILLAEKPVTQLNFSKIGGQDKAIEELKKGILYPVKYPAVYAPEDITRGFILHGPAGTGKTALCKALANEAGINCEYISAPAFQQKYVGESEANVREFFDRLTKSQPSIGIIDEIDAVGATRGTGDHYDDKLIDQILTCMTDIYDNGDNVYILGLTNKYEGLDPALKRAERFSKHILVGEPDKDGVRQIFKIHTEGRPLDKDVNEEELIDKMHSIKTVGSDIKFITKLAKEEMMKRLGIYEKMEKGTFKDSDIENATIKHQDFLNAIEAFKTQHKSNNRNPIGFGK